MTTRLAFPLRLLATASLLGLAACDDIPQEAYFNRGTPESLLDASAEVASFQLSDPSSVGQMSDWIYQDQPTRAELSCAAGDPLCEDARTALSQLGVSVSEGAGPEGSVMLVYERMLARDCENRYIDNPYNPYNLNHPTFGCSMAANIVQHVTDKTQFVSPPLKGYVDGNQAAQAADAARLHDYVPVQVNPNFQGLASDLSNVSGGN